jgi:hypothetical protein
MNAFGRLLYEISHDETVDSKEYKEQKGFDKGTE